MKLQDVIQLQVIFYALTGDQNHLLDSETFNRAMFRYLAAVTTKGRPLTACDVEFWDERMSPLSRRTLRKVAGRWTEVQSPSLPTRRRSVGSWLDIICHGLMAVVVVWTICRVCWLITIILLYQSRANHRFHSV